MLINRKACKVLMKELEAQTSREFWTALDIKVNVILRRAVKRANGHRVTPLTLQEINETRIGPR